MKQFKHLKAQRMTFYAHFKQAIRYYWLIQKAALCVFLHAFWPDAHPYTASKLIIKLADDFTEKKP